MRLFPTAAARIEAFRQGLRELGYVEGKNIVIELRFQRGNDRRRRLSPSSCVSRWMSSFPAGATVTRAVKEATSTIPIVMGQDTDPVETVSLPAWHDLVEILLVWHVFPRRIAESDWSF